MKNISIIREPFVLVLIGLPASGKSTWTKFFLDKYGDSLEREVVYVSSDKHIEALAKDRGTNYSQEFANSIGHATAKMKAEANDAIKGELNIIWDQTNLSKKKRRGILNKIPDTWQKIAVDFDVSDKVLSERLERRAREEGKFIPPHVMENMCKSYVAPSKDEGFEIIEKVRK